MTKDTMDFNTVLGLLTLSLLLTISVIVYYLYVWLENRFISQLVCQDLRFPRDANSTDVTYRAGSRVDADAVPRLTTGTADEGESSIYKLLVPRSQRSVGVGTVEDTIHGRRKQVVININALGKTGTVKGTSPVALKTEVGLVTIPFDHHFSSQFEKKYHHSLDTIFGNLQRVIETNGLVEKLYGSRVKGRSTSTINLAKWIGRKRCLFTMQSPESASEKFQDVVVCTSEEFLLSRTDDNGSYSLNLELDWNGWSSDTLTENNEKRIVVKKDLSDFGQSGQQKRKSHQGVGNRKCWRKWKSQPIIQQEVDADDMYTVTGDRDEK